MKNASLYFLIILCIAYSMPLHSFIYETYVLRKWLPEQKYYHHIIGLSDFHDRSIPANSTQRAHLLKQLDCCITQNIKVIVEDLSSPNHQGDFGCEKFFLQSHTGLLSGMSQECQKRGVEVENIEYRYCRVIALAPLLHNLSIEPNNIHITQHITVNHMLQEIEKALHSIESYSHTNHLLQSHVQHITKQIGEELTSCGIRGYIQKSVNKYVSTLTNKTQRLAFLKKILTLDSCLLDIKLLNAVLCSESKRIVVALAGGTHIKNMCLLLQQAGYQLIYHTPSSLTREYDLKKCHIGSDIINKSFCLKPSPASLHFLEQFLHTY